MNPEEEIKEYADRFISYTRAVMMYECFGIDYRHLFKDKENDQTRNPVSNCPDEKLRDHDA